MNAGFLLHRMPHRPPTLAAVAAMAVVLACGGTREADSSADADSPAPDDSQDTPDGGGDTPETDAAVDSDVPEDSAPDSGDDTGQAGPPPWPTAPAWPGRFTDISGPLTQDPRYVPDRGSPTTTAPDLAPAHWIDLDADGQPELVVSMSADGNWDVATQHVLRLTGGTLVTAPALAGRVPAGMGVLHTVHDLDGDGHLDLAGSSRSAVSWGMPDGSFSAAQYLPFSTPVPHDPHDTVWDVDADGLLDLIKTPNLCLQGGLPTVFHQQGRRAFAERLDLFGPGSDAAAVIYTFVPVPLTDGRLQLAVTGALCDVPHPGFFTETARTVDDLPVFTLEDAAPPTAWWRQHPQFQPTPSFVATAPMGGLVADLTDDAFFDLIIPAWGGSWDAVTAI